MKPVQSRRLAFAALLSLSFSSASCHAATEHWGWIEQSWLMPERMQAKAKLDTGALTSSLDARNIHRYKKDGERWVRFDVVLPTADSKAPVSVTFERKVLRLIKVRGAGGSDSRPVVAMDICLGAKLLREQFSLRDRGNMNYPVLLGRRTLEHLGAVDVVSRTFTRKPTCGALAAQ
ncbi:ATP-dependent zinc protease [Pseudomonas aeruginosa]|nr:ATP-dependent zinc protease [Pseudomonas aeruginosa]